MVIGPAPGALVIGLPVIRLLVMGRAAIGLLVIGLPVIRLSVIGLLVIGLTAARWLSDLLLTGPLGYRTGWLWDWQRGMVMGPVGYRTSGGALVIGPGRGALVMGPCHGYRTQVEQLELGKVGPLGKVG